MAPPKKRRPQQEFGFVDPDRDNPLHDEIVKWIDANIEDVLMLVFKLPRRPARVWTQWEAVVQRQRGGGGLGHVDLMAVLEDRRHEVELEETFPAHKALFEAKTRIDSLGDLFRQIRRYKIGIIANDSVILMPMVVVCPDDSQAALIRQQGVHFLKYAPDMTWQLGGV